MADGVGLENRYRETYRGFESHVLRSDSPCSHHAVGSLRSWPIGVYVANPTPAPVAVGNALVHTCNTSAFRWRRERWEYL